MEMEDDGDRECRLQASITSVVSVMLVMSVPRDVDTSGRDLILSRSPSDMSHSSNEQSSLEHSYNQMISFNFIILDIVIGVRISYKF